LLSAPALEAAGYFDPSAVRKLAAKCRAGGPIGAGDNMAFLGVLSTQLLDSMLVRRGAEVFRRSDVAAVV
jgi:asparagine synthase (glutamine-hydrolysing)